MAYLDHNASAPLSDEVSAQMMAWMREGVANPDAIHRPGIRARKILEEARSQLASLVGARPSEIVFTSGATEANQTIIAHLAKRGARIVALSTEHPAVLAPLDALKGAHRLVGVDPQGRVDLDALDAALTDADALVMMAANNETGVITDLEAVAKRVDAHQVMWHCDAVQLARWGSLSMKEGFGRSVTSYALSAHKIGGPQGVGALVLRGGGLAPLIRGGPQERGRRAGTPNVIGAGAFGLAAAALPADHDHVSTLRDRLEQGLIAAYPASRVHGEGSTRLPNTSFIALKAQGEWVDGEGLTLELASRGVAVSTGAACASGEARPSHVLSAMGVDAEEAQASLRFSLGPETTEADIDCALDALRGALCEG